MKQKECKGKQSIKNEVEIKSDRGTSTGHGSIECDLHNVNETANGSVSMDSGSQCQDVFLNDTIATNGSFDTSPELKNTDNVEEITGSNSHSEPNYAGAASDRTNLSPFTTNHDIPETEEKPVLDLTSLKDNRHSSQCQDDCLIDNPLVNSPCDASHGRKICVLSEEGTFSESRPGSKCVSSENESVPVHLQSHEQAHLEENPASHSHQEDIAKEAHVDISDETNDDNTCFDPVPSSGEAFAEKTEEEENEKPDVSVSSLSGTDDNCWVDKSNVDNQIDCETGNKVPVASEAASDAMNCKERVIHASSES